MQFSKVVTFLHRETEIECREEYLVVEYNLGDKVSTTKTSGNQTKSGDKVSTTKSNSVTLSREHMIYNASKDDFVRQETLS